MRQDTLKRLSDTAEWLNRATIYSEPESDHHNALARQMMEWFVAKIPAPRAPFSAIIDVGAGAGVALDALKEYGVTSKRSIAINYLQVDASNCEGKGYWSIKADFHDLESICRNNWVTAADIVIARHSLEHSWAPVMVLKQIHDVLALDGYFYMEVPAPGTSCRHESNTSHYSVLSIGGWRMLLRLVGFEIIETATIDLDTPVGPDQYYAFACKKGTPEQDK